ncbi:MAG TPA: type II secretion system protein, partial [Campylobacterales bacterium]|nr:type II secretion system protein [Campylobacterales bacterium]
MKRSGFSLVELVLSIVIIAIALMTIPLMLNQSAKSNQFALMQESILAARTKMGNILSFKWD